MIMRRRRSEHRSTGGITINLTPLVDVIFILTIFFLLVSRFSSAEQVPMQLPSPTDSQANAIRIPERVTINCRLAEPSDAAGSGVLYSIGPNRPEPLAVLSDRLAQMKQIRPDVKVFVRADRRLRYADVRAVMHLIARNRIEVLNVGAHQSEEHRP